jgi:alpha-mannosidase
MALSITSVESTDLFAGPPECPTQIVRVVYAGASGGETVRIAGQGITAGTVPGTVPGEGVAEIPVAVDDPEPGRTRAATVDVAGTIVDFVFTDAEPGWTMFMVSHFHYDPVWWNTQAAYTSEWTEEPAGRARQTNGFALVRAHLEMARRDPDYTFVLAEVDYLKPYWDTHPEDRDDLRRLVRQGRIEIMGGTYNEPNTNLTSPETAIRNFVHGMGFQRHIMGADPATAWQLDVFGHDPQFPAMAAGAGLTSSSWARGPHHQWGPMAGDGDPARMQFASEFEWIAPSGVGLLTHYMPAHYSAGWWMDSATTLAESESATLDLFRRLKTVAATRNVLLPVGTDYTPPNKWVTEIHRDWNARYTWPRFVCALPGEFFAAVRAELSARGVELTPQTRDMNPVYTGKDVSFIDTKQAHRAAEAALLDAERFATLARMLTGAEYPEPALAKAWVQLAYGAHHDAITGSESDQVYLDLLTGWRDAWEIGRTVRDNALAAISGALGGAPIMVWNPLAHKRTDIATAHLTERLSAGVELVDDQGVRVPVLVEADGRTLTWVASAVPGLGFRAYRVEPGAAGLGWQPIEGTAIANGRYRIRVDPDRGGAVVSLIRDGRELIGGGVGNELAVYDEYPSHPQAGEGPWHLLPRGPVVGSSENAAEVHAYRCDVGQRLLVRGRIDGLLRYTQTLTLWDRVDRVDCRTTIDDYTGEDRLLRVRWPTPVPGGMPVSEVGDAVIGRGFALIHQPGSATSVDTADHPWTLENPAYGWFGLSSAARIRLGQGNVRAISVAEVVTPSESESAPLGRDLLVALVRSGVTATCSGADKPRYGHLDVDSNLPDIRIALGGPECNAFTAAVLAEAGPDYSAELRRQLDAGGTARIFVPAAAPLRESWVPGADLRAVRALPVLVVAGHGEALRDAVAELAEDLADAEIGVSQAVPTGDHPFDDRTVALLNRGMPSFGVESGGTMHMSVMRSCTGWPSGVWTTHEPRRAPDGSNFQLQHWTHSFDYALVADAGDWRVARIPFRSAEFSRPLLTVLGAGGGILPAPESLLRIDAESVALEALKPAGNPTAEGRSAGADRYTMLRLVETYGRPVGVSVGSALGSVRPLAKTRLLEDDPQPIDGIGLEGFEIATLIADVQATPRAPAGAPLGPETEAAQPLYARYWLHNRGPAPLGGLPVVAYLHPERVEAVGAQVRLRLTAASDCTDAVVSGRVEMACAPGWSARPASLPFDLQPGAHLEAEVVVTSPDDVEPGLYPVCARLAAGGPELPAAWRQTVEDICMLAVGDQRDSHVLRLVDGPADVVVAPGDTARLAVVIGTDVRAGLNVEGHLVSPWGTWDWIGPAVVGATLPAGGEVRLVFDVSPPASAEPGQWWALVRVAAAGHLLYSPAARVVVR